MQLNLLQFIQKCSRGGEAGTRPNSKSIKLNSLRSNTKPVSRRALPDFHFHDIGKDLIQTEHHWEVAAQKRGLVQTVIICNKMGASEAA